MTLGTFEDREVLSASVAVRNAGDGLSESLRVDPVILHSGQKVTVAMECEVDRIEFRPVKDTHGFQRVHVLRAGAATIIDSSSVQKALDQQKKRIAAAAELEGQAAIDEEEDEGGEE